MIIYCEECGAKNILADGSPEKPGERLRCRYCHDLLVINRALPIDDSPPVQKPLMVSRLVLTYQDLSIEHGGPGRQITMGRQKGCDIRIQDERVSRVHAVIEYNHGKFCLSDRSLNGTYILISNRQGRTINQKDIMLVGQGIIGLGGMVDEDSPDAIGFRIRSR